MNSKRGKVAREQQKNQVESNLKGMMIQKITPLGTLQTSTSAVVALLVSTFKWEDTFQCLLSERLSEGEILKISTDFDNRFEKNGGVLNLVKEYD